MSCYFNSNLRIASERQSEKKTTQDLTHFEKGFTHISTLIDVSNESDKLWKFKVLEDNHLEAPGDSLFVLTFNTLLNQQIANSLRFCANIRERPPHETNEWKELFARQFEEQWTFFN